MIWYLNGTFPIIPTLGLFGCLWGETPITDCKCRMLGAPSSHDSSPKNGNTRAKHDKHVVSLTYTNPDFLTHSHLNLSPKSGSFATLFMATLDGPQVLFLQDYRRSLDWTWPKMNYGSVYPAWINESSRILRISLISYVSYFPYSYVYLTDITHFSHS